MRLNRTLLSLGLILLLAPSAWARKGISLKSLSPEVREEVLKRFPQIEKEKLSMEQVDALIRFLHTRPQFDQVQIVDDGGADYKIQFTKVKKVDDVKFEGLSAISESTARNYFVVKSGDSFNQDQIIENGEALRQAYRNLGFQNAIVDIELPPTEKDEDLITVIVKVTENHQTKVNTISFSSPNDALNKLLAKKVMSPEHGEPLTDSTMTDIQKKIRENLSRESYVRADVTGPEIKFNSDESSADLNYRIRHAEKYLVNFEGNMAYRDPKIKDVLDIEHFFSANPNIGPELANKVKNFYLSQGYARADVSYKESDGRNNFEKKLLLTIDEGPQVRIQRILVNGKISRGSDYYEKYLRQNSSALIKDGYYNKEDMDTGFKNLTLQLQNEGFLLSKIVSTRTSYNREKNQLTVVVNLDEGPLTEIEKVQFSGNEVYPSEKLLQVSKLQSSGALKLSQIDTALANLKNFYHDNGYIEMMILNEKEDLVTYDETNTKAQLNFKIFEGPQVKIASIAIEGNNFTKDYVIQHELTMKVGDIVTPTKIDDSVARLQRTGFFSTIEVKTLEEKTNTANRTLIVRVTEHDPGILTIGAGATSERTLTLRGYAGVAYRNIAGTGRGVSLRLEGNYNIAQIKYLESKIAFGYLEPYLFDSQVRGRLNLSSTQTVTDYSLHQVTQLTQFNSSIEKDLSNKILGTYNVWGLAVVKQFGYDNSYPDNLKRWVDIATTGPTVDIDFRDDPFNPTRGTFTRLTSEYSSPFLGSTHTVEYTLSTASFTHYLKLGKNADGPVVWANNLQGGYLQNLDTRGGGGVPYDLKGFILGGQTTVRGFEAGTEDVFPNKSDLKSDQYNLTTSARMFLIKSEMRFPIYGKFGGAVFYDGGYVAIQNLPLPDNYRDSTGIGLRYNTPVGPVSLEWAFKLDKRQGEAGNRVNLSIGTF